MEVILKKIAKILHIDNCDMNIVTHGTQRLFRIFEKLTTQPEDPTFEDDVLAAEILTDEAGARALMQSLFQLINPPPEREYKIKRVAKGKRIAAVSASGVRFSFGPAWNTAVIAAKGIAVNVAHREKLNMHGTHLGVPIPETMSPRELCAAIAEAMAEEEEVAE